MMHMSKYPNDRIAELLEEIHKPTTTDEQFIQLAMNIDEPPLIGPLQFAQSRPINIPPHPGFADYQPVSNVTLQCKIDDLHESVKRHQLMIGTLHEQVDNQARKIREQERDLKKKDRTIKEQQDHIKLLQRPSNWVNEKKKKPEGNDQ